MRIFVSCTNGSSTNLMTMRSVEKAMKKLGVPIARIHHCVISEERSSASQYDVAFTPVNFLQIFQQAGKHRITVIGIKNVMSVKEIQEKYMAPDRY